MSGLFVLLGAVMVIVVALVGCSDANNMNQQAKKNPLEPSSLFQDGASARPLIHDTVAVGTIHDIRRERSLMPNAAATSSQPSAMGLAMAELQRGEVQFNVWCAPCHGRAGYGDGMVARRGFPKPPSFHTDELRHASDEHINQVITYGLGYMPDYGKSIKPADRQAIIAYVRALQLSQHAPLKDAPAKQQQILKAIDAAHQAEPEEIQP